MIIAYGVFSRRFEGPKFSNGLSKYRRTSEHLGIQMK